MASAAVIGLPTDVIANPYFTRMTPVRWWDYLVLAATVSLTAIWATLPGSGAGRSSGTPAANILGALAVGCPACNKVVVALLGWSGALTMWASAQPWLGAGAVVVMLAVVLVKRRTAAGRAPSHDTAFDTGPACLWRPSPDAAVPTDRAAPRAHP